MGEQNHVDPRELGVNVMIWMDSAQDNDSTKRRPTSEMNINDKCNYTKL